MRFLFPLAFVALIGWAAYGVWSTRPLVHAPGVLVAEQPVQEDQLTSVLPEVAGFRLKAVARYTICGRVLGRKRYWDPPSAKLVPRDLALGWGPMSDQAVLDQLQFSMGNRFLFYQWRNAPPIPEDEIMRHASNNHVIPASRAVTRAIKRLRVGEVVRLQGWLVDATGPDGGHWSTSRTRGDTGNGACEIFYVEAMERVAAPESVVVARSTAL